MKYKLQIKTLLILILIVTMLEHNICAQSTSVQINVGESFTIHSSLLNEGRTILIYIPEGYSESSESYPVLYLTDAETHLIQTGGTTSFLSSAGIDYMPKLIIH